MKHAMHVSLVTLKKTIRHILHDAPRRKPLAVQEWVCMTFTKSINRNVNDSPDTISMLLAEPKKPHLTSGDQW